MTGENSSVQSVSPGKPDELERMAAAVDADLSAGSAGAPGAAPAEPADIGPEIAAMLQAGVSMLSPAMPFLPQCYTPEVCGRIGITLGAVAVKHGWNLGELMTPEIALALVAIPPTIQAFVMGKAHFAKLQAPPAQPPAPPPPAGQAGIRAVSAG